MKKLTLTALLITMAIVFVPLASAQSMEETADRTPDEFLYGADVFMDEVGMTLGTRNVSDVAEERAAEIHIMAQENNEEGIEKASKNLNQVAKRARNQNKGLSKAQEILENVPANEDASKGLQTVKQNVSQTVEDRIPTDVGV